MQKYCKHAVTIIYLLSRAHVTQMYRNMQAGKWQNRQEESMPLEAYNSDEIGQLEPVMSRNRFSMPILTHKLWHCGSGQGLFDKGTYSEDELRGMAHCSSSAATGCFSKRPIQLQPEPGSVHFSPGYNAHCCWLTEELKLHDKKIYPVWMCCAFPSKPNCEFLWLRETLCL